MKYRCGNGMKEALASDPVEIRSTKVLKQYQENYSVLIPVVEDDDSEEEGLTKVLVRFDHDNQTMQEEFDSASSAYRYARENTHLGPSVIRCSQSDATVELGFGDDYEEINITYYDDELAEMLDRGC